MSIVVDIKAFATQVNELSCEMFDRVTKHARSNIWATGGASRSN